MSGKAPPRLGPDALPSTPRSVWLFAALVALTLHLLLGSLALARLEQEASDDDTGAAGIEIGIELASPAQAAPDLPPGPESDASIASPAVSEQPRENEPVEMPKDVPVETPEPERAVTEQDVTKPIEKEPEKKPVVTPSEESAAQEATSAPAIENAPPAEKSVTVDPGTGASKRRAQLTWQKQLVAHLDKHKRYPPGRSNANAEILVNLVLDRLGNVVTAAVIKSSGDKAFDAAAVAMVRRSSPVPAPPPLVADEGLSFSLPVVFRRNTRH
ncbi:MAG: energy transducer TonB [Rhizobiales bacterium]|nr:energy transducer TonB [Hyphomicrobiales bacterium]